MKIFRENSNIFLSGTSAEAWWIYALIWIGVILIISSAFYFGSYKHKASDKEREKYIQLLDEGATLRSVLEQSRLNSQKALFIFTFFTKSFFIQIKR